MERINTYNANRLSFKEMYSVIGGGDCRWECREDTNHGCNGDVSITISNDKGEIIGGMTVMNKCQQKEVLA